MKKLVKSFLSNESGATAIEYGLIAGAIGVVLVPVLGATGTALLGKFNQITGALT